MGWAVLALGKSKETKKAGGSWITGSTSRQNQVGKGIGVLTGAVGGWWIAV